MSRFSVHRRAIVRLASLSLLLIAAAAAVAATCSTAYCTLDLNSRIYIFNNTWGSSSSPSGWWQTITTNSSTSWRTDFYWPSGSQNYNVKAYPSAVLGWHWGWKKTGTGLPVQISAGKNINTSFSFSASFGGGTGNVAYDLWIHNVSNPDWSVNPTDEVMIWVWRTGGAGPLGSKIASGVSINGATWDVYQGNIGWNVFSFVRTSNTTSGSYNLKNFLNWLVSKGKLSSSKYLTSVEFGSEIFWGSGYVNFSNYTCVVQ